VVLNPIIFSTAAKKFPPSVEREFFKNIFLSNRMKT